MNYRSISRAIDFYSKIGYRYIEVPWTVSKEAIDVTKPLGTKYYKFEDKYLVGSGEQSFIQLMLDGRLGPGRHSCWSPCFRDDVIDQLHRRYFMKVELIDYLPFDPRISLNAMIKDAQGFITTSILDKVNNDLEINGVEVGSYGIRTYGKHTWVYGTGVAEPRYTQALVNDFNRTY